jgi:hypothetical protein
MAITFPIPQLLSNLTNNIKTPSAINSSIKPPSIPSVPGNISTSANGGSTNIFGKNAIALNAGLDVYAWKIPFILINRFFIDRHNIAQFSIFNDEFLPRIKLKLSYKNSYFLYLYLPRKGDRVNFLMKSETSSFYDIDEQKTEIRCDFIINSVNVSGHEYGHMSEDNQSITIDIEGQLFIPKLFKKVSNVWKDKSSKDALKEICEELKIGFKTNFDETNDKMNWLCPMDTYYSMIQYIVQHAWIDDDSFFHAYIDIFYNLNFINVNDVLQEKTTKEEEKNMVVENVDFMDFYERAEELKISNKVLITNFPTAKTTNYFIQNISFRNKLDAATVYNGEGRGIMWYNSDGIESEYKDKVIKSQELREPFYTNDYDDLNAKVLDPIYEQNFGGLEYQLPKHNVHKNYVKAKWNNFQKLQDFHLFEINCKLRMFNHIIQRSNHLYVLLITTEMNTLLYLDEYNTDIKDGKTEPEAKLDKVMSGAYYIRGINYHWFNGHEDFSQEVLCFRKTKPIDPIKIMANKGSAKNKEAGFASNSPVTPDLPKIKTVPVLPSIPNLASLLPFSVPKFTPPPLPTFFNIPGLSLPNISLPSLPNITLPTLPSIPDFALPKIELPNISGALDTLGTVVATGAAAANLVTTAIETGSSVINDVNSAVEAIRVGVQEELPQTLSNISNFLNGAAKTTIASPAVPVATVPSNSISNESTLPSPTLPGEPGETRFQ